MKKLPKDAFPVFFLLATSLFLVFQNYGPGTFLTGWDTFHPEFDFGLNLKRLLWGVWRDNQGLGAVAAHAHMADLPRVFILWILHFFLPLSFLRYAYVFLCLVFGPLGIYFLVKYLFARGQSHTEGVIGFLAGLFYLLNLSTLQQFYTVLEIFATQYAFLPWIIFFTLKFLRQGSQKNLLVFALLTLLASSQALSPHLWYPFFGVWFLFLASYFFGRRQQLLFPTLKKILILIVLTLAINAYWLLPNLYHIKTSSFIPREAKQNRLNSQEFLLRNREFGYLKDVALLKGFYFTWDIYDFKQEKFVKLMGPWITHLNNKAVSAIGYGFFGLVVLGVVLTLFRKDRLFLAFLPFFVIPFIFLMNHAFTFDRLFDWLLQFSLFKEGLRFSFTKLVILMSFAYTIYFSYFLRWFFQTVGNSWKALPTIPVISFVLGVFLIIYAFPMFQGQLISPKLKIPIPNDYFQFWQFMKKQPDGVVLSLPLYNTPGWQFYSWGYQGAGFLWFGLKQPLLDRDFDRWSIVNEQAFREFHYALYSTNSDYLSTNFKKYAVSYIVWDKNIITPYEKNRRQIIYEKEITTLLDDLMKQKRLKKTASFGQLEVFQIMPSPKRLTVKNISVSVSPAYRWSHFDFAYQKWGDYLSNKQNTTNTNGVRLFYYPFRTYLNPQDRLDDAFFEMTDDAYLIKNLHVPDFDLLTTPDPALFPHEITGNVSLSKNKLKGAYQLNFVSSTKTQTISFDAPAISDRNPSVKGLFLDQKRRILQFKSNSFQVGAYLSLENLGHTSGYLIQVRARNITGLPLRVCLKNFYSRLCSLYDELSKSPQFTPDIFVIPPSDSNMGYGLSLDNLSFGRYDSVNDIKEITIKPFPYQFLTQLYFTNMATKPTTSFTDRPKNEILILNQAFEKNWRAYRVETADSRRLDLRFQNLFKTFFPFIFGTEIKNHVLVNNWANGWRLDNDLESNNPKSNNLTSIIIVFLPQYLEFLGFGMLIITFCGLFFLKSNKSNLKD